MKYRITFFMALFFASTIMAAEVDYTKQINHEYHQGNEEKLFFLLQNPKNDDERKRVLAWLEEKNLSDSRYLYIHAETLAVINKRNEAIVKLFEAMMTTRMDAIRCKDPSPTVNNLMKWEIKSMPMMQTYADLPKKDKDAIYTSAYRKAQQFLGPGILEEHIWVCEHNTSFQAGVFTLPEGETIEIEPPAKTEPELIPDAEWNGKKQKIIAEFLNGIRGM